MKNQSRKKNYGKRPTRNQKRGAGSNNYRSKDKDASEIRDGEETSHKYNDVSWYAKNDRMLNDSASFSYNNPVGTLIGTPNLFTRTQSGVRETYVDISSPSLMVCDYVPMIGVSTDSTSPANLAAQNIYSYVRYMNSGAKNYDQADLMIYLMAMDSIYMLWNWAKRMYGYARVYSQVNRTLPKAMAIGDNVALDDIVSNMADMRYDLNNLAAQISSFCVPAVMPLFIRHSWLASNVYKDSDNDKAQMYMFRPLCYYQYDETGSQYGGQLVAQYITQPKSGLWYDTDGTVLKVSQIMKMIKGALDKLAYSEDIGVMSGDILKAYGQENLFKIAPVEPDYMVVPVYNEEVLNQIHNSTALNFGTPNQAFVERFNITQDPNSGYLIQNPTIPVAVEVMRSNALINMPWDSVTPANTMVGTRLTALFARSTKNGSVVIEAAGSEILFGRHIVFTGSSSNPSVGYYTVYISDNVLIQANVDSIEDNLTMLARISNFDWHPLIALWCKRIDGETTVMEFRGWMGDLNNYTVIHSYELNQMHTAALMSEFNVPQIGSF